MSSPNKAPTTVERNPYFQRYLGVLPQESQVDRKLAAAYIARHAQDREDFIDLVDLLGLDDVVEDSLGTTWRHAS